MFSTRPVGMLLPDLQHVDSGFRRGSDILAEELGMAMRLCGARNIGDLGRELIRYRGDR